MAGRRAIKGWRLVSRYLPYFLFKPLFGDRKRWGLQADRSDPEFVHWKQDCCTRFYLDSQKGGVGEMVNHWGFRIMEQVDLAGLSVLELGPGIIEHTRYAKNLPERYVLMDMDQGSLEASGEILAEWGVKDIQLIRVESAAIPLEENSVDVVVTFHQLEHIYELDTYLEEIRRVLRPEGALVGAVPTEGSLAWGLGRYLTSRRYVKKNMDIDYDKIICWEHPQFVDTIQAALDARFTPVISKKRPFSFLPLDVNLSWSFLYRNTK